jgi:hypothetical protein
VRDLGRAQGSVSRFGANATQTSGRMRAFTLAGAAMAATVVAAGTAVAALTKRNLDNIDSMSKQARAVGLAVNQYQAMALVANEAGVETDKLSKLIVKMQDSIGNLAQGTTTQVDAFQRLGLSMSDIGGLGADEQFRIIAERIAAIGDPATRTSTALDIFGKSGAEALTMFQGYGAAVEEAAAFQREFGLAVSDFDAQQIEAANDAMGRLGLATEGLGTALAVALAPSIIAVSEGLAGLISNLTSGSAKLDEMFGSAERAAAVLGTEIYDALASSRGAVNENADAIDGLIYNYDALNTTVNATSGAITDATAALLDGGFDELALKVSGVGDEMQELQSKFSQGEISAGEFEQAMSDAAVEATRLLEEAAAINGVQMGDAINQVGLLRGALATALGVAQSLRVSLPGNSAVPDSAVQFGPGPSTRSGVFLPDASVPGVRPPAAPNDIDFGLPGSGGGGGGGGDTLEARLERMREEFASELEVEAEHFAARQELLDEALASRQLTQDEYNALMEEAQQRHQETMTQIDAWRYGTALDKAGEFFAGMENILAAGGQRMTKAAAIAGAAQALISTYQGAAKELEKGTLGFASAAAVLAKGFAFVTAIKSAGSGSSGGTRGGAGGGGSAQPAGGQQATTPLDVRLSGIGAGDLFSGAQIGGLLDRLADEAGDRGYRIMVAA